MTLQLSGYFDDNFGDDYMMKLIAHGLPEIRFVIQEQDKPNSLLLEEKNVSAVQKVDDNLRKLVVVGSGFMINSAPAARSELKRLLKGEHPGNYCLGCNIEPFGNKFREYLIKRKLRKFELMVCRDKKSFEWLTSNNKKSELKCLPDILFSMPDDWLRTREQQGNNLGISVMNTGEDVKSREYRRVMAETADFYIRNTERDVLLLAFNSGSEDDLSACEKVRELSEFPERIKIVSHGINGEIIKAYRNCNKIVATRFHSAVLAIRMGIDMYPIIYREKMRNMLTDIKYSSKGCDFGKLDADEIKEFTVSEAKAFQLPDEIRASAKDYTRIFGDFLNNNK